jgi:hypothetical protein
MANYVTLTGTGASWQVAMQAKSLPRTYVIRFTPSTGSIWGVVGHVVGNTHWLVGQRAGGYLSVEKFDGSSYTIVQSVDNNTPQIADNNGEVTVLFTEMRYGRKEDVWQMVAVWWNHRLLLSYFESKTSISVADGQMGLAVWGANTVTFNNLRVPSMSETSEIVTLDPGESPMSALQRVIQGRNLKFFIRFDRSLKAWKPSKSYTQMGILDVNMESYRLRYQPQIIKTHCRMMGAYEESNAIRVDLVRKYGHRFIEENNPFLMTEADCYKEGLAVLRRLEEQSETISGQCTPVHFGEVEDKVAVLDLPWLLDGLTHSHQGPLHLSSISARKYAYE